MEKTRRSILIPVALYERVKALAAAERRTFSAELAQLLAEALQAREHPARRRAMAQGQQ